MRAGATGGLEASIDRSIVLRVPEPPVALEAAITSSGPYHPRAVAGHGSGVGGVPHTMATGEATSGLEVPFGLNASPDFFRVCLDRREPNPTQGGSGL